MGCGAHDHCMVSDEMQRHLATIAELLAADHEAMLEAWSGLYRRESAQRPSLTEGDFRSLYGAHLRALWPVLTQGERWSLAPVIAQHTQELVGRRIPFSEASGVLHLFPEVVSVVLQRKLARELRGPSYHAALGRLTHCTVAMMAQCYYGRPESEATTFELVPGIVGVSPAITMLKRELLSRARSPGAVLLTGERGSGRATAARALHQLRCSAAQRLVVFDASGLPAGRVALELFGAPPSSRGGLLKEIGRGMIHLAEVTALPLEVQARLVECLDETSFIGAPPDSRAARCQFIASTTWDPREAVDAGVLLPELWYRLAPSRVHVPPLRARGEDIELLVLHVLDRLAGRGGPAVRRIEPEALGLLRVQPWPGNVRQLEDVIELAATRARGARLTVTDVQDALSRPSARAGDRGRAAAEAAAASYSIEEAERATILRALRDSRGNKVQAARLLGISRHRLYDRLRRWDLRDLGEPR